MPELPEVEVTRRSLLGHLPGSRILAVRMGKPLRWPLGVAPEGLVGRQVQDVRRRGKYLLLDLDQGVLVVCDTRLATMGYGRRLMAALPPMRRLQSAAQFEEALEALTRTSTSALASPA